MSRFVVPTVVDSTHTTITIADTAEVLEIIREEQVTLSESTTYVELEDKTEEECKKEVTCNCTCRKVESKDKITPEDVENILKENEIKLREEYEKRLEIEMGFVRDRFDFILSNEQIRASYMLREAHRERQEKITALQTQLECKNLAGLMYVMCAERRRSKLEKMQLIEEYTNYIRALQDILTEGQELILHLSRGYKTAARVDNEWREKMTKIVTEFMSFIYHYAGGAPETNQFYFDLPRLLKTEAPLLENPKEDPCEVEEDEEEPEYAEADDDRAWWDGLDQDSRPFVMFGDMAEFTPPRRRDVLKAVRAPKTAPKKWKEYVFHEMFLKADCPNADIIKDVYPTKLPTTGKWECTVEDTQEDPKRKESSTSRRVTRQSIDIRGAMGSLLKIITSTNMNVQNTTKATLLGARDSMEIQSSTKLREKSQRGKSHQSIDSPNVVLNVGRRKTSLFRDNAEYAGDGEEKSRQESQKNEEEEMSDDDESPLGSIHNDSLQMIQTPSPRKDRINYEKICPLEKCQRMQVDSFMRSLPPYMRSSPYTHFEQTYEEYETCSPEQLEILRKRIEAKKSKHSHMPLEQSPLEEWANDIPGVETQTCEPEDKLPPCTCRQPTQVPSNGVVFNVEDLVPVKQALETINKACFFDENIDFDRFKVIGAHDRDHQTTVPPKYDFKQRRYYEIRKILKQHPSLLDIFQANTRC